MCVSIAVHMQAPLLDVAVSQEMVMTLRHGGGGSVTVVAVAVVLVVGAVEVVVTRSCGVGLELGADGG